MLILASGVGAGVGVGTAGTVEIAEGVAIIRGGGIGAVVEVGTGDGEVNGRQDGVGIILNTYGVGRVTKGLAIGEGAMRLTR